MAERAKESGCRRAFGMKLFRWPMSEFKFACPVCGQHITAGSHAEGSELSCPTCFRKIVVPQAPTSADPKFILSAAEANKPRAPRIGVQTPSSAAEASSNKFLPVLIVASLVVVGTASGVFFALRSKSSSPDNPIQASVSLAPAQPHGAIGVGAWNTRVEYTNVVVTKGTQVLYRSDFRIKDPGWRVYNGDWIATNGVFRQKGIAVDCRAIAGNAEWSDYTITLRARRLSGREGFLILFNVVDDHNWTWWNVGGWDNSRHGLEFSVAGRKSTVAPSVPGRLEQGRWYDVRIELNGSRIRCYLDGALIQEAHYPSATPAATTNALRQIPSLRQPDREVYPMGSAISPARSLAVAS
jgi:hypothetical protein